jgi:hypothetical protein
VVVIDSKSSELGQAGYNQLLQLVPSQVQHLQLLEVFECISRHTDDVIVAKGQCL